MKLAIISPYPPLKGGISKESEFLYNILKDIYPLNIYCFKKLYPNILYPSSLQIDNSVKVNNDNKNIHYSINIINLISWFKTSNLIINDRCTHLIFRFWNPFFIPLYSFIIYQVRKNNSKIRIFCICDNIFPHERFIFDKNIIKYFLKKFNGYLVMSSDSEEKLNKLIGNESKIIKSILPIKNTFNEKIPQNIALKKLNFKKKPKLLLLFFGFVRAYKGLDLIFNALANLKNMDIKLLIAGECYKDKNKYKKLIDKNNLSNSIIWHNKYILDSEINIYFSASDAIILPYKKMSQSGIVPLAYNYNKLIIASDLMSFKEHIVNNETGYLFKKNNPISLKNTLEDVYYNHNFKLSSDLIEDHKKKYTNQNLINDISSLLKL